MRNGRIVGNERKIDKEFGGQGPAILRAKQGLAILRARQEPAILRATSESFSQ